MTLGPVMMDLVGTAPNAVETKQLGHVAVGGVILFTRNFASVKQLHALCENLRAIRPDLLIAADTEGGRVQRFRLGFSRLPPVRAYLAAAADDLQQAAKLAHAGGAVLAAELLACGVDLAFTPVLDLDGGVSEIIGDRSFAASSASVATLAGAHRQGMRAAGMAATGKHFPGHGFVAPDSHYELPRDERPWERIWAEDLRPYRSLMADGLESVMAAHVLYPAVDAQRPASVSPVWLLQILRSRLGFEGAVFCDDLSMGGLASIGDVTARAGAALAAGCDMLPVCNRPDELAQLLRQWRFEPGPDSAPRLRALRSQQPAEGLEALQHNSEYLKQIKILKEHFEIRYEP